MSKPSKSPASVTKPKPGTASFTPQFSVPRFVTSWSRSCPCPCWPAACCCWPAPFSCSPWKQPAAMSTTTARTSPKRRVLTESPLSEKWCGGSLTLSDRSDRLSECSAGEPLGERLEPLDGLRAEHESNVALGHWPAPSDHARGG